jgi:hypothetical protein
MNKHETGAAEALAAAGLAADDAKGWQKIEPVIYRFRHGHRNFSIWGIRRGCWRITRPAARQVASAMPRGIKKARNAHCVL